MRNHSLTGKQTRYLRGIGHHLKPLVQIGKEGMSSGSIQNILQCLEDHELIKIKLLETCPCDRKKAAIEIAGMTGSHVVQIIGRTILLYRRGEAPEIMLP
jgi:RNA-binding protein